MPTARVSGADVPTRLHTAQIGLIWRTLCPSALSRSSLIRRMGRQRQSLTWGTLILVYAPVTVPPKWLKWGNGKSVVQIDSR